MTRAAVAVFCACLLAGAAFAQQAADLERRLPSLSGLERARALTELTALLQNDKPRQAIAYGTEALALFAATPDPANHIRVLNEMAWAHMVLGEYDRAIARATEARQLAERAGDRGGLAGAINNLGGIAQRRGDAVTAADRFAEALAIHRERGAQADIAAALNNLGFVYTTALADYEKGLAYHVEALAVRERLGDKAAIALSLNNIGIVYARLGDYDRALEYFQKSLELRRGLGTPNRVAATLHNIGDVHNDRGNFAQALEYHQQALQIRAEIGDQAGVALSHNSLGSIYTSMKQLDRAGTHLTQSLSLAEKQGDKGTAGRALLGLARLERMRGRPADALRYALRAQAIAQETKAQELSRRALEELAASQEQAGQTAAALATYKRFKQVSDDIFNVERTKRVELLERRYQAEKREREIERLEAERVTHELTAARRLVQRNAIGGGALLLGLVGFGLYRRRVESARIAERLSVTDTLTGLANRRFLLQTIGADVAASARRYRVAKEAPPDADLIFLLVDLDHFKSVNDEFGHDAGDRVLQQTADILREACRASDIIVRWGGEEFLVVARFVDRRIAPTMAERIRTAVAEHPFDLGNGRKTQRTCSIGVAAYPQRPEDPEAVSWEAIVSRADEALYAAKRGGRDRWVIV
jgi:diguanylate cyclase (GGDEF)-like protein